MHDIQIANGCRGLYLTTGVRFQFSNTPWHSWVCSLETGPEQTSSPVQKLWGELKPIFTRADSAVWIIEFRARFLEEKAPECIEIKIIRGTSATKAKWSEAPSRSDNRESEVLRFANREKKKATVRKYNYCNDELNKVIKGGWRCREREAGVPLMSVSAVRPRVDWGQAQLC